jgi:3-hydroxyacyl-[acyl-carrier-protein] dehydratase
MKDPASIDRFLPHRAPFILLDAVLDAVPGVSARAEKTFSCSDPLLRDGTCVSEMLLVEAMAQCAGVAAAASAADRNGVLVAIDRFQAHGPVVSGDRLRIEARVLKKIGPMVKARATVHVGADLRAEGDLVLRLGMLPNAEA